MQQTPILCGKCKGKDFLEITDGQWTKTLWEWDEKKKSYREAYSKSDGNGDHWFECADCGESVKDNQEEALYKALT